MSGELPRVALVTGADSGIGRAAALLLASEGFDVGITMHEDDEGARRTARGGRVGGGSAARSSGSTLRHRTPATSSTASPTRSEVSAFSSTWPAPGTPTSALDLDLETWNRVLATDLTGPFLCAQRAARMHGARRAEAVASSTSRASTSTCLASGAAAYCAAKAGLGMLTQVLALELGEHGITVNAVAPGEIATEMTGQDESDAFRQPRPGNPLGRPGHVDRGRLRHRLPRVAARHLRHGRLVRGRRRPHAHERPRARRRGRRVAPTVTSGTPRFADVAQVAAFAVCVILAGLVVFQIALAAGAPWGHYAWGGQHRVLPLRLRVGSVVSALTYVLMAYVVLARADLITSSLSDDVLRVVAWALAGYLLVGIPLNLASRSRPERLVMTPVVATLCLLTVVVALG